MPTQYSPKSIYLQTTGVLAFVCLFVSWTPNTSDLSTMIEEGTINFYFLEFQGQQNQFLPLGARNELPLFSGINPMHVSGSKPVRAVKRETISLFKLLNQSLTIKSVVASEWIMIILLPLYRSIQVQYPDSSLLIYQHCENHEIQAYFGKRWPIRWSPLYSVFFKSCFRKQKSL